MIETRRVRYEEDLSAWSVEQAALLRARRADRLDWDRLAEEIEWMVGGGRRELKNRLSIILLYLLKGREQPARGGELAQDSAHPTAPHQGLAS